jgi:hydroxymethylpyrimidine pyrophosphatase-like HAD family hydrolase
MRYFCLACDFDGTLATDGRVLGSTVQALERVASSGRKLLLVTGRRMDDLRPVFPQYGMFERIVAENGAVLYRPGNRDAKVLADAPSEKFIAALRKHQVPLEVGHSVVATLRPYDHVVLRVIRELGLELHVIYNKDAVMVLPSGVNKGTGLVAALAELGISRHNTVAIGDAENDHSLLSVCECGAAVANAIPTLKERADITTIEPNGKGVEELIEKLLLNDLRDVKTRRSRDEIPFGTTAEG